MITEAGVSSPTVREGSRRTPIVQALPHGWATDTFRETHVQLSVAPPELVNLSQSFL